MRLALNNGSRALSFSILDESQCMLKRLLEFATMARFTILMLSRLNERFEERSDG